MQLWRVPIGYNAQPFFSLVMSGKWYDEAGWNLPQSGAKALGNALGRILPSPVPLFAAVGATVSEKSRVSFANEKRFKELFARIPGIQNYVPGMMPLTKKEKDIGDNRSAWRWWEKYTSAGMFTKRYANAGAWWQQVFSMGGARISGEGRAGTGEVQRLQERARALDSKFADIQDDALRLATLFVSKEIDTPQLIAAANDILARHGLDTPANEALFFERIKNNIKKVSAGKNWTHLEIHKRNNLRRNQRALEWLRRQQ